ncbi:MAG TPA: HNH endonuclease [Verrucomicrobiae bacterium]|nr:HNH endonuclease [Verrucomicrobiae bacterium]
MARLKGQLVRSGEVTWSETQDLGGADKIDFVPYDITRLKQVTSGSSVKVSACIYCGSTEKLTKEHVIPYGLNGTSTIANGSCDKCQKVTHRFEAAILRGELQELRYKLRMSSRSKHKKIANDQGALRHSVITVFPIFPLPNYFGERADNGLRVERVQIVASDRNDVEKDGLDHTLMPIEFAKLMAKIAYCFAWSTGLQNAIADTSGVVNAFMKDSGSLGKYVGTRRPPYRRADTPGHSLTAGCVAEKRAVYVNVQLLAERGTPTYIVALGELKEGWAYRSDPLLP